MGIRELFESVDADRSLEEILTGDVDGRAERLLWLRARTESGFQRGPGSVRLWIEGSEKPGADADSVEVLSVTPDEASGTRAFCDAVERLLAGRGLVDSTAPRQTWLEYCNVPLRHHIESATTTIYLRLASRYGYPHRSRLTRLAADYVPEPSTNPTAQLERALNYAELALARFSLEGDATRDELDVAESLLEESEHEGEENAYYYLLRALLTYWRDRDQRTTDPFLVRALELDPQSAETRFVRWYLSPHRERRELARAAADNPTYLRARVYLAAYYDPDPTRRLASLLEVRSDLAPAHYQQAVILKKAKDWDGASKSLELAGRSGYSPKTIYRLMALVDLKRSEFESSEKWLVRALWTSDPDVADSYVHAVESQGTARQRLFEELRETMAEAERMRGYATLEENITLALVSAHLHRPDIARLRADEFRFEREDKTGLVSAAAATVFRLIDEQVLADRYAKEASDFLFPPLSAG